MNNDSYTGMSLIVKTVTRMTVGCVLLFGIYIVLHGDVSPGGGFAGGVIIALCLVHIMLAFGAESAVSNMSKNFVSNLESLGALMFLFIAFIGFFGGSLGTGTLTFSNMAVTLKVGVGLFTIFLTLVILESIKKDRNK